MDQLQTLLSNLVQGMDDAARSGLRIVLILVIAWLAIAVSHRVIRGFRLKLTARMSDREAIQRAETLGRALRYAASVVISALTLMLVLSELGISVAPLLGAAGVAGVAIGFGAQSLVKDYFAGLSILLEDQVRQGDVVKLGEHAGVVEEVTLRYVRLRDYDGNVHFVPNGTIDSVVSMGRQFAFAVVDIGVSYDTNLDLAIRTMEDVGQQLAAVEPHNAQILEPLEIAGVDQWADSAVVIRARFKVAPLQQWTVRRAYLKKLKEAFDAKEIEIPFPHVTVVPKANDLTMGLLLGQRQGVAPEGASPESAQR